MKRRTMLSGAALAGIALTGTSAAAAYAKNRDVTVGEVQEGLVMPSELLGYEVPYMLYLPAEYDPATNYPVLYMLHGTEGTCDAWLHDGNAIECLDAAIAEGRMPPTVTVFPDGRRDPAAPPLEQDLTYWMNDLSGEFAYHDMLMSEFLPFITNEHHAGGEKANTVMGGLSMGGFGALSFSMRNPDSFVAAIALSSGVRTEQEIIDLPMPDWNWRFAQAWGRDLAGPDRLSDAYREWNLLDVIGRTDPEVLGRTPLWMDCGEQDSLLPGNEEVRQALVDKQVPHEYTTRPGAHDWDVWSAALPLALDFVGKHLNA